ncbi:MAG: hypothetical protein HFF09_03655 [Oscillospiraceae bacterium]|nr:hypothetical protein [Oscillospiraceae bacterium]
MNNILRKLTSRKLWMALAGVATGICIALGGDASELQTVAGTVAAVISAVAYVLTEGKVDAEALAQAVQGGLERSEEEKTKAAQRSVLSAKRGESDLPVPESAGVAMASGGAQNGSSK